MGSPRNWLTRIANTFIKTITFTATGDGAVGAVTLGTVTGRILLLHGSAHCTTLLTGAGTIEVGTANNTAALIAQTTGTAIDATEYWRDATPEAEVSPATVDMNVSADIILTVASATITAGVIEFAWSWLPVSDDGHLA